MPQSLDAREQELASKCEESDVAFAKSRADCTLVKDLRLALKSLSASRGWHEAVKSGISADILRNVKVKEEKTHHQYGTLETMAASLDQLFVSATNMNAEERPKVIGHIERLAASLMEATEQRSAYVTVRAFLPTQTAKSFEAGWHIDGGYLLPEGPEYKLAIALSGRGTLLSAPTDGQRNQFTALVTQALELECKRRRKEAREKYRNTLDELMKQCKLTSMTDCSRAVLFQVWGEEKGLIHSTPLLDQHRVYASVVAGPAPGVARFRTKMGEW